ncbi:hypothetical protein AB0E85_09495 [Streptomyces sp. NPDC029044]|uniref:hypothetical protein n=1 Tax=Streptomyces sp. NPDC029044 TaxID=3157198 RepID=UPI0033F95DF9
MPYATDSPSVQRENGDAIWVRDTRDDGHHAAVQWWTSGQSASDDHVCHDCAGKFEGDTRLFNGDAGPAMSSKAS